MEYLLLGYAAVVFCFLLIVAIDTLKEYFYPTPKLSDEEANKIYKEASDFVHSKHRPWMYDDTFAEYLAFVNEISVKRWNELYGSEL